VNEYEKDGAEIYRKSFAIIRAKADLSRFSPEESQVAVRMIHSCGMVDLVDDIAFSPAWSSRHAPPCRPAPASRATCRWWPAE